MTTRGLEDLDGGLGSCLPTDDILFLEESCSGQRSDGKARGAPRLAGSSSWTHVLQDPGTVAKEDPGMSKGITKAETTGPRRVPAHRKSQAAPPLKPPPPPPPPPRDDLPWGELTLNKLLVLASLVALLGSALQLCQDAVTGEVAVAAPQQWVPSSLPPKRPQVQAQPPVPKPPLPVPPSQLTEPKPEPLGPQAQRQDKPEPPEAQGEPGGSSPEVSGEEPAPFGVREFQERPKKGEKPKKKRRREERHQAPSRRWEVRGGHRPWTQDSRELEHEKQQAWSFRRHDRDRPRQKPRGGKGRN